MKNRFNNFISMREQGEEKSNLSVPSRVKLGKNVGEFMPFIVNRGSRANLRMLLKAFEISDQVGVGYTTIDKQDGEVEPKLKKKNIYLTGGAVRDHLMGKTPRNYNLVTEATASEIKMILKHPDNEYMELQPAEPEIAKEQRYRNLPSSSTKNKVFFATRWDKSGKEMEFTVRVNGEDFSLATLSKSPKSRMTDIDSSDATGSLENDALNRDFTINAMYIPLKNSDGDNTELIDPFGGAHHIKGKNIVSVNNDFESRFNEDPSVAMRYVRMLCKYGDSSKPCKKIVTVIKGNDRLKDIPKDIARKEFFASLEDPDIDTRKMLRTMDDFGMLKNLIPNYSLSDMTPSIRGDRWMTPAWLMKDMNPDDAMNDLSGNGWNKSEASDISYLIKMLNWAKNNFDPNMFYDLKKCKCGLTKNKISDWMSMNGHKSPHVKAFLSHDDSDLQPYVDSPLGKRVNPAYINLLGRTPRGDDFDMARRSLSTQRFLDKI
jgi:tRNA nucleotidyltransferase/poly(A) polymerase